MSPIRTDSSLDLNAVLDIAEARASELADGHLTLMRFTTGWKCMYGTPDMETQARAEIQDLPTHASARDALLSAVKPITGGTTGGR